MQFLSITFVTGSTTHFFNTFSTTYYKLHVLKPGQQPVRDQFALQVSQFFEQDQQHVRDQFELQVPCYSAFCQVLHGQI